MSKADTRIDRREGKQVRLSQYITVVCTIGVAFALATESVEAQKKKGIKGRYLVVEDGVSLHDYAGALIVLKPAEIQADKDRPVDTEGVRTSSDDVLSEKLTGTGLFGDILNAMPLEPPKNIPILVLTTKLTLQHGSQVKRWLIGGGSGKSKLHIRLDFSDVRSGKKVAFFNGYGTGAGLFSFQAGGVQRMSLDDLQENYNKLAELLKKEMGDTEPH